MDGGGGYPPVDPEVERPRGYTEAISGDQSWDQYGLRIKWTEPEVPGEFRNPLNEPLRLRVCVETKKGLQVPPDDITAWCWTHMRFQDNPHGIWKEIKLLYNPKCTQWDDHGINTYVFQTYVTPTLNNNYRLTFNVKLGNVMIWANHFQIDNLLDVREKPARGTQTTIFPSVHFACNFTDDKSVKTESTVRNDPSGRTESNVRNEPTGRSEANVRNEPTGRSESNVRNEPTGRSEANVRNEPTISARQSAHTPRSVHTPSRQASNASRFSAHLREDDRISLGGDEPKEESKEEPKEEKVVTEEDMDMLVML